MFHVVMNNETFRHVIVSIAMLLIWSILHEIACKLFWGKIACMPIGKYVVHIMKEARAKLWEHVWKQCGHHWKSISKSWGVRGEKETTIEQQQQLFTLYANAWSRIDQVHDHQWNSQIVVNRNEHQLTCMTMPEHQWASLTHTNDINARVCNSPNTRCTSMHRCLTVSMDVWWCVDSHQFFVEVHRVV